MGNHEYIVLVTGWCIVAGLLWFLWTSRKRRPTSPVVQVQSHTFSFPPTDDDLCSVKPLHDIDPAQTVPFWTTDSWQHVTVNIENGALIATRVGGSTKYVETTVRLVEFAK